MVTRVPALRMSRYILVGVGGDCLVRCVSSRGAGISEAGTRITWLVLAMMDVMGSLCDWARAADSVSWRCSVSNIKARLVFVSTLLKTRKGRRCVSPVPEGAVGFASFAGGGRGVGALGGTLGIL
jgi:hypothetical protein